MSRDASPGGLTLRLEEEFRKTPLAENLGHSLAPQALEPLGPADYPAFGRGDLLVTRHRGEFIKPCPGTLNYNCCGLTIFHFGLGCTIGCRYCILEAYLGTAALVLFGNVAEGLADLRELLRRPPAERPRRFCTGEFTDSLLLDKRTGLAAELITMFAETEGAVLELKTKTDHTDHLLGLKHKGRTVISFSVNAPDICRCEESGAAPLSARLKAAQRAAAAGFPVGLHFDPLIVHPNWEEGYARTAQMIGEHLAGAEVAWVSLGCFRYLPSLKEVMLARHPETSIYDGEFIMGGDGKMRYPRPLRTRMYRTLVKALREALPEKTVIYMCMESPRVWRDVFGRDPETEGLAAELDRRAMELCG
ncbi:MAG: DNA photolyase [Candidatus Adiutrix sp.]|jgi:spore photoproduct lyase|nr:DNA photolyase [Candidatus Adiutrix sp.]